MAGESPFQRYRENFDKAFGSNASGSNDESAEKLDTRAALTLPTPEPEQDNEPASGSKKKWKRPNPWLEFGVQALLCLFTLGAFVAAGIYASIANGQKSAMEDTLKQIQRQTTLMHQQLAGTQGAMIRFKATVIGDSENLGGTATVENAGHIPASDVSLKITVSVKEYPSQKVLWGPVSEQLSPGVVLPLERDPQGFNQINLPIPLSIDKPTRNAVTSGKAFVYLEWQGSYNNGFDDVVQVPSAQHPSCQAFIMLSTPVCTNNRQTMQSSAPCETVESLIKDIARYKETVAKTRENCRDKN